MQRPRLLILLLALLAATSAAGPPDAGDDEPDIPTPAPTVGPPSRDQGERERWLCAAIRAAIAARPLGRTQLGVAVADPLDGRLVCAVNAEARLNIASNVKLITLGAALSYLGSEHRLRTTVHALRVEGGVVRGDLFLRGGGDPSLDRPGLEALADELGRRGVTRVAGRLCVDSTLFGAPGLPPAFEAQEDDAGFRAAVGATSLAGNAVQVRVLPGARPGDPARVLVEPPSGYVRVESNVATVGSGRTSVYAATSDAGDATLLQVTGAIRADSEGVSFHKRVVDPTRFVAEAFRLVLAGRRIPVADPAPCAAAVPEGALVLATRESPPLSVLARDLGKWSSNFAAEMLLLALGAEVGGAPGSFAKGRAAVGAWLADVGIPAGSYVYKNGSGLYDASRFSAAQVVRVLGAIRRDYRIAADVEAALAIAGADGTLRARMRGGPAERYVRAKTGTLSGVRCLAGYAGASTRPPLAFAVLVNEAFGAAGPEARGLLDEIAGLIVLSLEASGG